MDKGIKFDLVYLDPPYKSDYVVKSMNMLNDKKLLNNNAIVVVEHDGKNDV